MTNDIKNLIEKIQEANKLIAEAQDKIKKTQESADASLKQAGRNLLISLRKEINSTLDKVVNKAVQQSFNPQELAKIISLLIKDYNGKDGVVISLKKEDAQILEKTLFSELKEEIKKGITLKAQEDISAGFVISFDSGKSHFDFTDKAIAEYLGQYLKPKLGEILKP